MKVDGKGGRGGLGKEVVDWLFVTIPRFHRFLFKETWSFGGVVVGPLCPMTGHTFTLRTERPPMEDVRNQFGAQTNTRLREEAQLPLLPDEQTIIGPCEKRVETPRGQE